MSSTTLKIVAIVAVILAIVLAFAGYRMSRSYAEQAEQAQRQAQTQAAAPRSDAAQTLAVVALKPLAAYQPIARDAVALVPVSVRPADPYDNIDDVVNKTPLVDIDAGAPVTRRYFREGNILARVIPEGHQALSVEINDVIAVGGFVRPGDIVDVLIYLRGGTGVDMPQSRILLEKVRVLAYEERIIDRPEGVKEDERQRSRTRTAVIAVAEKDTTRLMLGASLGELRLALHGQPNLASDEGVSGEAVVAAASPAPAATPATVAAAGSARSTPDKVIGLAELARMQRAGVQAPTPPKVEVFRGNVREVVSTQ